MMLLYSTMIKISTAILTMLIHIFISLQLLVTGMGPPGGGRNHITGRFTRHCNIVAIDSFDDATMTKIFTAISDWNYNQGFDGAFLRLGKVRKLIVMIFISLSAVVLDTGKCG